MRKDVVEIALKQIMLDADEREAIEAIVNRYRFDPFGGTYWVASVAYQAGRIAGIRQERARRNGKATPRIPKGEQVSRKDIELAMDMAQASRAGRSPGTLEG